MEDLQETLLILLKKLQKIGLKLMQMILFMMIVNMLLSFIRTKPMKEQSFLTIFLCRGKEKNR